MYDVEFHLVFRVEDEAELQDLINSLGKQGPYVMDVEVPAELRDMGRVA